MKRRTGRLLVLLGLVISSIFLMHPGPGVTAAMPHLTFAPGDVFVSTEENGTVQWWNPDGTPNAVLAGVVPGSAEGMRFDAAGNLYVTHWCRDPLCATGNTVEMFNTNGASQGTFGSGYNCNPSALAFDAAGNAYVGQADCAGAVLKFSSGGLPSTAYIVAAERRASFKIDLAADGCTLFYTSWGPNVKRFNVCTQTQLPDFNLAPMPGGEAIGLRLLPDGGVLVSSGAVIARLDASGALVQTYSLPGGGYQYWFGLDLVGDGTFWAVNNVTSSLSSSSVSSTDNVYKFNLATGAVQASFNTKTPVIDVAVSPGVKAAMRTTFAPGDVFVSTEDSGVVQWWNPDGTLNAVLVGVVPGSAEGMRFDATGNLYVTHWCRDPSCATGNTVERFNTNGASQGTFGSGYNCNPHALAFDAAGNAYVGQADCTGAVLRFSVGSQLPTTYFVAAERRGSFWVDLAADGCTLFYTSWGPNVKRFNVCTQTQLPDFNLAPLPGDTTGLRVLPDGGVLVSCGPVIARLDASGGLVQTYSLPGGEYQYWFGLDLVGDGTFWAVNDYWQYVSLSVNNYTSPVSHTSSVHKFDLATRALRASFNTRTPAIDVAVSR